MISTGSCLNKYPIPRNSHCFCCNPSLCASLFLLFMCARLKLVLLPFSWAEMCLPSAAGPILQLPGQKAGPCRVSVLNTQGLQGPAPSHSRHIFHVWRGCTGALICACMERWLRACTLHLCMPAVSAQAWTFHLPVGEVAVCWGPPGIRHVVRAVVGSGGWSLFQISLFLSFSLCRIF